MLTQDQARQIVLLASNYGNYEAAAESAAQSGYTILTKKMSDKSTATWLQLTALLESLTEPV